MTEAEWFACVNPEPMLHSLRETGRLTGRKVRLFECACVRRVWDMVTDERSRYAVEVAERFVDGLADEQEREVAALAARYAFSDTMLFRNEPQRFLIAAQAARFCSSMPSIDIDEALAVVSACSLISRDPDSGLSGRDNERAVACSTIRELFGPSPTSVTPEQSWRTSTVMMLGRGIYYEKAFDRLQVLADALQDAGCHNDDILNHCRDERQVHLRGCWVVDAVLGRS